MIDTVLFDLDGTLTDTFDGIANAVAYALGKLDKPVPARGELNAFIGPPIAHSFNTRCGLDDETTERAVAYYREYYAQKGVFELTVIDGMPETLKALREHGIKQYMATSKPELFAGQIAQKFGFSQYLDGVAGASFDKSRSEKDQVIGYALDRFGVEPGRAVMVGDRKYDVEGAKKFGIRCIGVLFGFGDRPELENAGADYIVSTPQELTQTILKLQTER